MKNSEFIVRLHAAMTAPNCYALGCFGQELTDNLINQKSKQYPEWYTKNRDKVKIGVFGFDCICFIKAILWGWTPQESAKYESNNVPDVNEEQMLAYCDNVTDGCDNMARGEYVWKKGHCGIYIGDDKIIHCTTNKIWGIGITSVKEFSPVKHGKLKWIDYSEDDSSARERCLDAIAMLYKYVKENWGK